MPTVRLDAYAKDYPSITNRIRASIFTQNDPAALISTIIDVTTGHPARTYTFPGLPRNNYGFSLDEIDGGGTPVRNLAFFAVSPGQIDGVLVRDDEQIKVDTTTGFDAGLSTVTFDGTGGKPNYIGWNIVPSELTGRGILVRGLDYSWDSTTGIIVWLQAGDVLQTGVWYNIHFDPILNPAGGSVPTINDFTTRIVNATGAINITDFGNNLIFEPGGNYMELTLPDITTVPQGRILRIETTKSVGTVVQCCRILPNGADTINFLRGNLYMMNNEAIEIYRIKRPDDSNEWRVRPLSGNFFSVGQSVSEDQIGTGVVCRQYFDGTLGRTDKHARIYNEYIIALPATQLVDYDDWATGNNKYFYSRANSADPSNANKFHFPDRRNSFERNNNAGKAGDFSSDTIAVHIHTVAPPSSNSQSGSGKTTTGGDPLGADGPVTPYTTLANVGAGTETKPKNYLINKYVLL